jgi:beta-glucanase (GH16 family)
MTLRALAVGAVLIVAVAILSAVAPRGGPSGTVPPRTPSPVPSELADGQSPSVVSPSPVGSSPYTFDEEFNGPALDPLWQRHFSCCGTLAGFDPSLATVANGVLSMAVSKQPDGWHGALIDTKATWTQLYGYFEARIKIPKGTGLWPAFWSYFSGDGTQAEIDTMEVCGAASSNAGSVLHNSVYWSDRNHASNETATVDLTTDFHVYAVDWRADHITFYLDGRTVWTFRQASHIPKVPLPLILNLGVGGNFCGAPNATTPDGAQMQVDWVRASR